MKSIVIPFYVLLLISCTRVPIGESGEEADALAHKVMKATGQKNWDDVKVVKWCFDNNHYHLWDRARELIKVKWDEVIIIESLSTRTGKVWLDGQLVDNEKKQKYLNKAYDFWANDSYWLNPFWKFFEDGVERKLVDYKGEDALLITHTTGGKTPGDSFLWLIDDEGLPYAWKLWVKIVPLKGYKFTWENWVTSLDELKISTKHKSKFTDITISNVEVAKSLKDIYGGEDPFSEIK